jgi:hypothetical protein
VTQLLLRGQVEGNDVGVEAKEGKHKHTENNCEQGYAEAGGIGDQGFEEQIVALLRAALQVVLFEDLRVVENVIRHA